jgi:hypothetical protein
MTPRYVEITQHKFHQLTGIQSNINLDVEECMREVAKRNDTVRFVKMHGEDAELDQVVLPAVLAYKGGDKFASLLPLLDELPDDSELSPISLETAFRKLVPSYPSPNKTIS